MQLVPSSSQSPYQQPSILSTLRFQHVPGADFNFFTLATLNLHSPKQYSSSAPQHCSGEQAGLLPSHFAQNVPSGHTLGVGLGIAELSASARGNSGGPVTHMASDPTKTSERTAMRIRANVVRFSNISSPPEKKRTTKVGAPTRLCAVRDRGAMRHDCCGEGSARRPRRRR
jgi:hypothetical protein